MLCYIRREDFVTSLHSLSCSLFDSLQVLDQNMQEMIDRYIMFAYSIEWVGCRIYYCLEKDVEGRKAVR